jgi:hypothetical protein
MCWLCEHWSTVKDDVNEAIKQATKQIRQASGQPRDKIIQQQVLDYANEVAVREREQVMPPNSNNIAPPPPIIALQQMAPDTSDVPLILSFTGTFGGNLRNDQWSSFSIDGHRAPQ